MEIGRFVSTSFAKADATKAAAPKPMVPRSFNVYMVRGRDEHGAKAISILDDERYRNAFRSIFAGHSVEFDDSSGKAEFLKKFFAADLVYLSLHSKPSVLIVGNGDRVEISDLINAYKAAGRGPKLVIVTGCRTILSKGKSDIASAMGIDDQSNDKAYIGFVPVAKGLFADQYFRVFLALWMKPLADGTYRTLEDARKNARAFIRKQLGQQTEQTGEIAKFYLADELVADELSIIGQDGLKATDL